MQHDTYPCKAHLGVHLCGALTHMLRYTDVQARYRPSPSSLSSEHALIVFSLCHTELLGGCNGTTCRNTL